MSLSPGHRLNHTGTCTPQIMEDNAGAFRHGVMVKVSDGNALYFRHNLSPTIPQVQARTNIDQVFELSTIAGNPLVLPMASWNAPNADFTRIDDHFALAIGVDDQDRPWIVGNAYDGGNKHDSVLRMVRCNTPGGSTNPANWVAITLASPGMAGIAACGDTKGFTYNHFRRLSNGTLIWFMSQRDENDKSRGRDFLAFYLDPGTNNWLPLITTTDTTDTLASGAPASFAAGHLAHARGVGSATPGSPQWWTGPANRVYLAGAHVEDRGGGVDRLHLMFLWRTADADGDSSQKPCYVYCDNPIGGSLNWKTIFGSAQTMPITWTNRGISTMITTNTCQRQASNAIAIDDLGRPHFIFQNGGSGVPPFAPDAAVPNYAVSLNPSTGEAGVMHVWWNGSAWQKEGIPYKAHYTTAGPVIVWMNNEGVMFCASNGKMRLSRDWGRESDFGQLLMASAPSGSEVNIDPVSYTRRGEISLMIPDGDTPRVYQLSQHAQMKPAAAAWQNINPGP